jgi:FkbM family methyltransferase
MGIEAMASLKMKTKVLLRSRSLAFTRDYFLDGAGGRRTYEWNGAPVHYRAGTTDPHLIYNILLKQGTKSEYALPPQVRLDPAAVGTVLDIGANIGIASRYFARCFPGAVVHAFEPDPGNCELLRANAAAEPRIRVHAFALGAEDGELELFDSDDQANRGGYSGYAMGINPGRSKKVPLKHAGRALAALGVTRADLIKIDTEGAECEILTALEPALLKSARVIMGELHGRRDFELLDFLQPAFHIGAKKQLHSRLFNFYAVNRELG